MPPPNEVCEAPHEPLLWEEGLEAIEESGSISDPLPTCEMPEVSEEEPSAEAGCDYAGDVPRGLDEPAEASACSLPVGDSPDRWTSEIDPVCSEELDFFERILLELELGEAMREQEEAGQCLPGPGDRIEEIRERLENSGDEGAGELVQGIERWEDAIVSGDDRAAEEISERIISGEPIACEDGRGEGATGGADTSTDSGGTFAEGREEVSGAGSDSPEPEEATPGDEGPYEDERVMLDDTVEEGPAEGSMRIAGAETPDADPAETPDSERPMAAASIGDDPDVDPIDTREGVGIAATAVDGDEIVLPGPAPALTAVSGIEDRPESYEIVVGPGGEGSSILVSSNLSSNETPSFIVSAESNRAEVIAGNSVTIRIPVANNERGALLCLSTNSSPRVVVQDPQDPIDGSRLLEQVTPINPRVRSTGVAGSNPLRGLIVLTRADGEGSSNLDPDVVSRYLATSGLACLAAGSQVITLTGIRSSGPTAALASNKGTPGYTINAAGPRGNNADHRGTGDGDARDGHKRPHFAELEEEEEGDDTPVVQVS